jgi:hypothetical protein
MIVIANIGNRNIRYKNQYFDRKLPEFSSFPSFREFTRDLLERFDTEKSHIEPQILPELIRHLNEVPRRLVLFYSDSPEGEWNGQDTVHESMILEKCFAQQYPNMKVRLMPLKCKVTDTDGLMRRYRSYMKGIIGEAEPEEHFVLCDAGGTPQQKSALKIISEFLLDDARYSVYNVNFAGAQSSVEKTDSVEYRKVITQEQICSLIGSGNYRGAQSVYGLNQQYSQGALSKALEIAASLFEININRACTLSAPSGFGKKDSADWPLFGTIAERSFYDAGDEPRWDGVFNTEQLFALRVILEVARINEANRHYGYAVLFHHIFIEQALSFVLKAKTGFDIDDKEGWDRLKEKLIAGQLFNGIEPPYGESWGEIFHASLPVKITLAEALRLPLFSRFVASFKSMNSTCLRKSNIQKTGLDQLRNKFAHEGRLITDDDWAEFKPEFAEWYVWLQMDRKNLFRELNSCIDKMLEK